MNVSSNSMGLCLEIMKIIVDKKFKNSYIGLLESELENSVLAM